MITAQILRLWLTIALNIYLLLSLDHGDVAMHIYVLCSTILIPYIWATRADTG